MPRSEVIVTRCHETNLKGDFIHYVIDVFIACTLLRVVGHVNGFQDEEIGEMGDETEINPRENEGTDWNHVPECFESWVDLLVVKDKGYASKVNWKIRCEDSCSQ